MQHDHGPLDPRHIEAVRRMHRAAAATLDRLDRTNVVTEASHDLLRRARRDPRRQQHQSATPGVDPRAL